MAKTRLISILDAATALGYKVTGKLTPELRMLDCLRYLEKYSLTKIFPDPAFIDPSTKKPLPFALKQSEVNKLVKKKDSSPE